MRRHNDQFGDWYRGGREVCVYGQYSQSVSSTAELIRLRSQTNWYIKIERYELLKAIYPLIEKWKGAYPDLRDIFRDDQEIEWLLVESVKSVRDASTLNRAKSLINFVIKTGYRAALRRRGTRRATALHQAARSQNHNLVHSLFGIYSKFDSVYMSESGSTHFLVACDYGLTDIVERFLDDRSDWPGDPNHVAPETGDSPLHLLVRHGNCKRATELLLAKGADPNLVDYREQTPLHLVCLSCDDVKLAKMLLDRCDDRYKPVRVDARDQMGNTPLHYALQNGFPRLAEFLLRQGADANLANDLGSSPLHLIVKRNKDDDLAARFFDVCDDVGQWVRVDARDALRRTPLQWAVMLFELRTIDLLCDRGADLSEFVFPGQNEFNSCFTSFWDLIEIQCDLRLASGLLAVVDTLEKRGYRMNRNDALTIMRLFRFHGLIETSAVPYEYWNDKEKFAARAKKIMIGLGLSLHDSIRSPPEEVAKLLLHTRHYAGFAAEWWELSEKPRKHLCEKLSETFFRKWALQSLGELVRHRLPILCCDLIVKKLMNKDLLSICLAAAEKKF